MFPIRINSWLLYSTKDEENFEYHYYKSYQIRVRIRVRVKVSHIQRRSLPAANLMALMETLALCCVSMDDSFHLPNFPHMALVNPLALPNDSNYALAKSPTQVHSNFIASFRQLIHFTMVEEKSSKCCQIGSILPHSG